MMIIINYIQVKTVYKYKSKSIKIEYILKRE